MTESKPAVFLDRDDTITNSHPRTAHLPRPGDLLDPDLVELLPGAGEAIAKLNAAGWPVVVFTSQGGIARGDMPPPFDRPRATLAQVELVNDRVRALLAGFDARLDAIYYCPFHPIGTVPRFTREHQWRKPQPGMLLSAAAELGLDLSRSWAVGDMARDTEAARNAGIPANQAVLLVKTGDADAGGANQGGPTAPDLARAAEMILGRNGR
jgi:D-glycero-D-manno-heptose 1,7-bisphosphate phosphatase